MKMKFRKKQLSLILMLSMLTMTSVQAETNTPVNKSNPPIKQRVLPPIDIDSSLTQPDYNLYLLSIGRAIYEQLESARQASVNKDVTNVKAALDLAQKTLNKLKMPNKVEALEKQSAIIRRDLMPLAPKLEDTIWVPVEAVLSEAVVAPADASNHKADTAAKVSVDNGLVISEYKLGIFSLKTIEQAIESVAESVNNKAPHWSGVVEAIQNALVEFHWYSKVPSQGLSATYSHTVNAYTLASAASFQPDQSQIVIDQLTKAMAEVKKEANTEDLQSELKILINKKKPNAKRIKALMGFIQEKLRYQRKQLFYKFMDDTAASEVTTPE